MSDLASAMEKAQSRRNCAGCRQIANYKTVHWGGLFGAHSDDTTWNELRDLKLNVTHTCGWTPT